MVLKFSVISSPTLPSPLVSALKSFPFLYVRQIAVPSNLSSQLYVSSGKILPNTICVCGDKIIYLATIIF